MYKENHLIEIGKLLCVDLICCHGGHASNRVVRGVVEVIIVYGKHT